MNSLLKLNTSAWRFLLTVLVLASVGALFIGSAAAGKKKSESQVSGDSFQLTLSNKLYSGDPQDKFLRQSCEPGQHASVSARVSAKGSGRVSAKASSRKTKMSSKRPATK